MTYGPVRVEIDALARGEFSRRLKNIGLYGFNISC